MPELDTRPKLQNLPRSLGVKIFVSVTFALVTISIATVGKIIETERNLLLSAKKRSGLMTAEVISKAITPLVYFKDSTATKDTLKLLNGSKDIEFIRVWTKPQAPFAEMITRGSPPREAPNLLLSKPKSTLQEELLYVSKPILSPTRKKRLGILQVAYNTEAEQLSLAKFTRMLLFIISLAALSVALLIYLCLRVFVTKPLSILTEEARQANSGQSFTNRITSRDEVGQLAEAFEGLTVRLARREDQIRGRNEDLKLVLEHIAQGYLLLNRSGQIVGEYSTIVQQWFGPPREQMYFWELIGRFDARRADWFEAGWQAIDEDLMPAEIYLAQLPNRISNGPITLDVGYQHFEEAGYLSKVILLLTDATDTVAAEEHKLALEESRVLLDILMESRNYFSSFFREANSLMNEITFGELDQSSLARALHTLKGLANSVGLASLAELCHRLEDNLDTHLELSPEERAELCRRWTNISKIAAEFLHSPQKLHVEMSEYNQLIESIQLQAPHDALLERVESWTKEPTSTRLQELRARAYQLVKDTSLDSITVVIEDNGLLLPTDGFRDFWPSLVHIVSNAISHAFQQAEMDRQPPPPTLTLRSIERDQETIIEVADNGIGIDWERLRTVAKKRSLPTSTKTDLVNALFTDGVSSKDSVSRLSGRGVGLAAVREVVNEMGGAIEVETAPNEGTCFRFSFPKNMRKNQRAA